ncbi:MAG: hypothetical protein Fur003_3200 [Candidatus Dojkabacteria bacterium]
MLLYELISIGYNRYRVQGIMIIHTITSFLGIYDYIVKARNWKVSTKSKTNNMFRSLLLVYPWFIIFFLNIVLIIKFSLNWEAYVYSRTSIAAVCWAALNTIFMFPAMQALTKDIIADFGSNMTFKSKSIGVLKFLSYNILPLIIVATLTYITPIYLTIYQRLNQSSPINAEVAFIKPGILVGIFEPQLQVNKLEKEFNRNFDLFLRFQAWGGQYKDFDRYLYEKLVTNNYYFILTWEPWNPWDRSESFKLKDIAEGKYDTYIRDWASQSASTSDSGQSLIIRWGHEMNNGSYPWSEQKPEDYIKAFIHIREIFKQEGSEAKFIFSPITTGSWYEYYPGNEYVDMFGFTALNFDVKSANGDIIMLEESVHNAELTNKPIIIVETSSAGNTDAKLLWMNKLEEGLKSELAEVDGIIWFNESNDPRTGGSNWSLGSYNSLPFKSLSMLFNKEMYNKFNKQYVEWEL